MEQKFYDFMIKIEDLESSKGNQDSTTLLVSYPENVQLKQWRHDLMLLPRKKSFLTHAISKSNQKNKH